MKHYSSSGNVDEKKETRFRTMSFAVFSNLFAYLIAAAAATSNETSTCKSY